MLFRSAVKPDPKEAERLELLLWTVEGCMSDWGLSMHQDSGLFARLKDSKDGRECYSAWSAQGVGADSLCVAQPVVHMQQLLLLPPLQALAASQIDVQKALRSRPSSVVKVSRRYPSICDLGVLTPLMYSSPILAFKSAASTSPTLHA